MPLVLSGCIDGGRDTCREDRPNGVPLRECLALVTKAATECSDVATYVTLARAARTMAALTGANFLAVALNAAVSLKPIIDLQHTGTLTFTLGCETWHELAHTQQPGKDSKLLDQGMQQRQPTAQLKLVVELYRTPSSSQRSVMHSNVNMSRMSCMRGRTSCCCSLMHSQQCVDDGLGVCVSQQVIADPAQPHAPPM
jgi:hypothetical protein